MKVRGMNIGHVSSITNVMTGAQQYNDLKDALLMPALNEGEQNKKYSATN